MRVEISFDSCYLVAAKTYTKIILSDSLKIGADAQTRTADLRITNALLYQLSYIGILAT